MDLTDSMKTLSKALDSWWRKMGREASGQLTHYVKIVGPWRTVRDMALVLLTLGLTANAVYEIVVGKESATLVAMLSMFGMGWLLILPICNVARSKDKRLIHRLQDQASRDRQTIAEMLGKVKDLKDALVDKLLESKKLKRQKQALEHLAHFISHDGKGMLQNNITIVEEWIDKNKPESTLHDSLSELVDSLRVLQVILFTSPGANREPDEFKNFIRITGSTYNISERSLKLFKQLIENYDDVEKPESSFDRTHKAKVISSQNCRGHIHENLTAQGNEHFFAYALTLLLQNAHRHGDTSLGPIRLAVCRTLGKCHVVVTNPGAPIRSEPFKLDVTSGKTKGNVKRQGYGLYIANEIVTALGGTLEYRFGAMGSIRFEIGGEHLDYNSAEPKSAETLFFDISNADRRKQKLRLTVTTYLGDQRPNNGGETGESVHEREYDVPLKHDAEVVDRDFGSRSFVPWTARVSLAERPALFIDFQRSSMLFFRIELSSSA